MNNDLFERVKNLSLELRTLIRQGVKEGVEERIERRNELLQEWFAGVTELIHMTNDQQDFLEDLLKEEQGLLNDLKEEQKTLAAQHSKQKKAGEYLKH